MSHIFISYSRADKNFALSVKGQLESAEAGTDDKAFDVWMDTQDIESGDLWKDSIVKAIETCSAFVIILSPSSERSIWVMRELIYAQEFKKPIFPILTDGAKVWPLVEDIHCAKTVEELKKGLRRLMRLFVCYSAEDEAFAAILIADLVAVGADVWQYENPNSSIAQASDACQMMLLIVSPESMSSSEIREQWKAFDNKGKQLLPVLYKQTRVPVSIRNKQPYINFLSQDYKLAFAQMSTVLSGFGINLRLDRKTSIPPQPQLPLDGDDMINEAKEAVWISGLTLDMFARKSEVLERVMKQNPQLHVRLLMLALDVSVCNETGDWIGKNDYIAASQAENPLFQQWVSRQSHQLTEAGRWVAQRLFTNQQILTDILKEAKGRLEIRTVSFRLATGYFIIDPEGSSEGMLTASPYFYQIDTMKAKQMGSQTTSPIFLSKNSPQETDRWWFEQYVGEFIRLWDSAQLWITN